VAGRAAPGSAARGLLAALLLAAAAAGAADRAGPLVTVGEVTDAAAVLWLRGTAPGPVEVRWGPAGQAPAGRAEVPVDAGGDLTAKVPLGPLAAGTRYRYAVAQGGGEATGEFTTAPAPDAAAPVRLAWSGDLGGRHGCRHATDGYPIFTALAARPVDFFVFVGDTVYADQACGGADRVPGYEFVARTLPQYRAKHRYNRAEPKVQAYFRTTSVYAIWDDHEVRNDFQGPGERLMAAGRRAFLDYFPIAPPPEEPGRLYRSVRWGRLLELFILDTRQYRSPNAQRDGPEKTMLGAAQKRWLLESVTRSPATWKVVVSSVSLSLPSGRPGRRDGWSGAGFFGGPVERPTGFSVERDAILRALRERGVQNLVFLVADVHHAEVIRHEPAPGWPVWELIAGPLSATVGQPRPLDDGLQPRSLFSMGGMENFGELTVDAQGATARVIDRYGEVRATIAMPAR
jgi:alkaline phosphatase D